MGLMHREHASRLPVDVEKVILVAAAGFVLVSGFLTLIGGCR